MKCPQCGYLAVRPGDWRSVHRIARPGYVEEAVCCPECTSFLLASPDSDIDPIEEGDEDYDKDIYHRFVRPEGVSEIIQEPRLMTRTPKTGDWIYVIDGEHKKGEGRLQEISDDIGVVQMAGFMSTNQNNIKRIPLRHLRTMVFDVYKVGMRMEVVRGPHAGKTGVIIWQSGSECLLKDEAGKEFGPVIYEHITRIDLEPVDSKEQDHGRGDHPHPG